MVTRPIFLLVNCVGFFLTIQTLVPKAMALNNPNADDGFMMKGHRSHKKNYITQNGVTYDVESFDPDKNPDGLSAFIADYANMINNDVVLLDKSEETKTSKRGNIKVKKLNQVIPELPCSCKSNVHIKTLGNNVFPRKVLTRICNDKTSCQKPFICKENYYNLTILNKRPFGTLPSSDEETFTIHQSLMLHWYVDHIPISVGCTCLSDYVVDDENN